MAALNESAVELARSLKVTRGRKLRTDGTVVETNVHHPTDDALLADGVRVIGRLVKRAKGFVEESIHKEQKGEPFRDRARSAKRLEQKIGRMALRRSQEAKGSYRAAYQRLVEVAKASIKQAGRVRTLIEGVPSAPKISEELSHFAELLERVISQTCRRVFKGERVSAKEKLVSVFEEHTSIIRRGKARKKTEFGKEGVAL